MLQLPENTVEDLLALLAVSFGYQPEESLVLAKLEEVDDVPSLRTDIPTPDQTLEAVIDLATTAADFGMTRIAVVAYTSDRATAAHLTELAARELKRRGMAPLTGIQVHGRRWWQSGTDGYAGPGREFDLSCHPFVLSAAMDGISVTTRDDLARMLDPAVDAVTRLLPAAVQAARVHDPTWVAGERQWLAALLADAVDGGDPVGDAELARVVAATGHPPLARVLSTHHDLHPGLGHLDVLLDWVTRSPDPQRAGLLWALADVARRERHPLAGVALDRLEQLEPESVRVAELRDLTRA